jgi:hypothetical protein
MVDKQKMAVAKDLRELEMSKINKRRTCNKIVPMRANLFNPIHKQPSTSPFMTKVSEIEQKPDSFMECAGGVCEIVWKPIPKVA